VIHNVPPGVWVEAAELRAPGRQIADRLDVMGVNAAQVLAGLDRRIKIGTGPFNEVFLTEESEYSIAEIREEEALLGAMSAQDWVDRLAATTPGDPDATSDRSLGTRGWLLNLIAGWDARNRLRAVLLAFPDAEVVAVFDNDTAGANGLQDLGQTKLPRNIRAMCYPALDLAKDYSTLGPPTLEHPRGSVARADVNGLAASIELYLGRDVLAQADGTLHPVQWKSFDVRMRRYQGEVTNKGGIQDAFRVKLALAIRNPEVVRSQDWDGLLAILDAILAAFGQPEGGDRDMWESTRVNLA
jgi:hypothetical protein